MRLLFIITSIFTLCFCKTPKQVGQQTKSSKIVVDTSFESLAYRNTKYSGLIDSCRVFSEYPQDSASLDAKILAYRIAKEIAMSDVSGKPCSLVTKICFSEEGIAIQAFAISSTYSKIKTKQFLKSMMEYRVRPVQNPLSKCPRCCQISINLSEYLY